VTGASLSPSHARKLHEEAQVKMMRLVRQIAVLLILAIMPVGAFAQRKGQDKRPPKPPVKVIENPKDNRPPPNRDRPKKDDRKKKPND